jgi:uncharacterized protein YegP (UPF0339 family)
MAAKFVLKKTSSGQFRFSLQAANGRTVLGSEGYADKRGALNGIQSVRKSAASDARFERRTGSNGQPYFVLLASNKQVIGQSEMYADKRNMESGIASVKANAPGAAVDDQTG